MQVPKVLHEAMVLLGVWNPFVQLLRGAQSFEALEQGVQRFKDDADKAYKALALKAHPDRSGGCEERMKSLNAAIEAVRKFGVQRPVPRPQFTVIRVSYGGGFGGFGGGFSTAPIGTTSGSWGW